MKGPSVSWMFLFTASVASWVMAAIGISIRNGWIRLQDESLAPILPGGSVLVATMLVFLSAGLFGVVRYLYELFRGRARIANHLWLSIFVLSIFLDAIAWSWA